MINKILAVALSSLFLNSPSLAETASHDEAALRKLNLEITAAEDAGDIKRLESILASQIGFRRANGVIVGRDQFLKDVKSRAATKTEIESVKIYGKDRAVVTCIVTMKINNEDAKFHNVRMFVRESSDWKLIGWANERLAN
ncbi:MAG: nuclear transport factor 2 family protein [Bdellovibrionota bacterium]